MKSYDYPLLTNLSQRFKIEKIPAGRAFYTLAFLRRDFIRIAMNYQYKTRIYSN
jgi:hypothetical protein